MKNHCFLRNHGVLPTDVVCPTCNLPCRYRKEQRVVLRAVEKNRQNSVSYYTGISLQGTHLSPSKILFFVNHWLQKNWNHKTRITCLNFSTATCGLEELLLGIYGELASDSKANRRCRRNRRDRRDYFFAGNITEVDL